MRIDRSPQNIPAQPTTAGTAPQPTETNDKANGPSPRGKANGVVRKLGTDHFNPTAEARLTAHFGDLLQTPDDPVTPPTDGSGTATDGSTNGDGDGVDTSAPAPVVDEPIIDETPTSPAYEPTDEPADDTLTGETNTEPAGPITVDLSGVVENQFTQTLNLVGQSLNVVG